MQEGENRRLSTSCAPAARSGNIPARRSVRNPLPWVRQTPPPPFGGSPLLSGEASGRCKRFLTTYILWGTQKPRANALGFVFYCAICEELLLQNNLAAQTGVCSDVLTAHLSVLERISLSRILLCLYHDPAGVASLVQADRIQRRTLRSRPDRPVR